VRFFFVLSIRQELNLGLAYSKSSWLFSNSLFHGWFAIAVNTYIYACVCWVAFGVLYVTKGRERLAVIGWLAGFLLSPITAMRPDWAVLVEHIGFFGDTVSFLAPLSLLPYPEIVGAGSPPGPPQS